MPKAAPEAHAEKLYPDYAEDELKALSYSTEIVGYTAYDAEQQAAENPDGIIEVHHGNLMEVRTPVEHEPRFALRVDGGWLTGRDHGEWGGELVYVTDDGEVNYVLNGNIEDAFRLGQRIVAVTGLSHLMSSSGLLFEVSRNSAGVWQAKPWVVLPGAPESSWLVESGELLISTFGGGTILVSEDGSQRMAPCVED